MSNAHKGEVDLEIEGQPYRLTFTTNAICEVEDLLGRGWFDIAGEMASWGPPTKADGKTPKDESPEQLRRRVGRIKMSLLRALFWGMLREHHQEITLKQAGDLLQAASSGVGMLELVNRVFERSMPPTTEPSENPPQPGAAANAGKNGTGKDSAGIGAS